MNSVYDIYQSGSSPNSSVSDTITSMDARDGSISAPVILL